MGADVEDPGKRGGGCTAAGDLIQGGGTGSSPLSVYNVGAYPPHGLDAGSVPTQGGPLNDGETTTAAI